MTTTSRTRRAVSLLAVVLLLGACTPSDEIIVDDPWTEPTEPGADSAAIYVTLENYTGSSDLLIDGYSPVCGRMETHRTETVDGVASTERASAADLRVDDADLLVLEPGGLHLMCLDLREPLVEGESISLEVTFEDHGVLIFDVPVEQR